MAVGDVLLWTEDGAHLVFMPQTGGIPYVLRTGISINARGAAIGYDDQFLYWSYEQLDEQVLYRFERID